MLGVAFISMLVFWVGIPSFVQSRAQERMAFWWPKGENASRNLARRVRRAFSNWIYLHTWTLILPSAVVYVGLVTLTLKSSSFDTWIRIVISYPVGALVAFGIAYFLGLKKTIQQDFRATCLQAAKAIARQADPRVAEEILGKAAASPKLRHRLAAATGFRFLGTEFALKALETLSQDPEPEVRKSAAGSLESIRAMLDGSGRISVAELAQLGDQLEVLQDRLEIAVDSAIRTQIQQRYNHIHDLMDKIVFEQLPLRRWDPHVFCMDCMCRSESMTYKDWSWLRCKRCLDVFHLKPGVVTVVGQIGGVAEAQLENGILRLPLWDPETRKASAAEIDVLELVPGSPVEYDWAVSAVVERLEAFTRDNEFRTRIVVGQGIVLAPNSLKLLDLIREPLPTKEGAG